MQAGRVKDKNNVVGIGGGGGAARVVRAALAHGELASTDPLKNTAGVPSMATGIAMAASSHASTLAQLATWRGNGRVEF